MLQSGREAAWHSLSQGGRGKLLTHNPGEMAALPPQSGGDSHPVRVEKLSLLSPEHCGKEHPPVPSVYIGRAWKKMETRTREKKEAQEPTFHRCLVLDWKIPCPAPRGTCLSQVAAGPAGLCEGLWPDSYKCVFLKPVSLSKPLHFLALVMRMSSLRMHLSTGLSATALSWVKSFHFEQYRTQIQH